MSTTYFRYKSRNLKVRVEGCGVGFRKRGTNCTRGWVTWGWVLWWRVWSPLTRAFYRLAHGGKEKRAATWRSRPEDKEDRRPRAPLPHKETSWFNPCEQQQHPPPLPLSLSLSLRPFHPFSGLQESFGRPPPRIPQSAPPGSFIPWRCYAAMTSGTETLTRVLPPPPPSSQPDVYTSCIYKCTAKSNRGPHRMPPGLCKPPSPPGYVKSPLNLTPPLHRAEDLKEHRYTKTALNLSSFFLSSALSYPAPYFSTSGNIKKVPGAVCGTSTLN